MITPFFGTSISGNAPSAIGGNTSYCSLVHGGAWILTTASARRDIIPVTGTISNLTITLAAPPDPGSVNGSFYTFTVRVGNPIADTVMTFTLSGDQTTATYGGSINVTAYDLCQMSCLATAGSGPTNPAATGQMMWSALFTGTTTKESLLATYTTPTPTLSSTIYMSPDGDNSASGSTDAIGAMIMPTAGTISNGALMLAGNPGTQAVATLYKNGIAQTLTMTAVSTTGVQDTTHSIAVVAGDTVSWQLVSGTTASRAAISARFVPTVDGESVEGIAGVNTIAGGGVTNWNFPGSGTNSSWSATESLRQVKLPRTIVAKKLYIGSSGAQWASGSFTVNMRLNSGSTDGGANTLSATIPANTSIGASNTTDSFTMTSSDSISVQGATVGATGAVNAQASMVFYIAPPAVTTTQGLMLTGVGS